MHFLLFILSDGEVKGPLTDALHNVRDINKSKVRDKPFSLLLFPVDFSSVLRTELLFIILSLI